MGETCVVDTNANLTNYFYFVSVITTYDTDCCML